MAEAGARAQRRRDQKRRRTRIIAITTAAVVGLVVAVGGALLLTREDEPSTRPAAAARSTTTTSSSTTTTTTVPVSTTVVPRSSDPVVALAQQYDGYYTGTWTNSTSGATGPATLELRIDPAGTIAVVATFDGDFFGGSGKLPRTIEATIDIGDPNASVVTKTKAFGEVTGRVDPSLALVLDAPAVPDPSVKAFSMTGRLREDQTGFDATYTVTYKNGTTSMGSVTTTCAPERQRPSEVTTLCAQ